MPLVFKTHEDSPDRVDIVGAGSLFPFGKGGVPVADAAQVVSELQEKNPDGSLKYDDDGEPIPLTGAKLTSAAKSFADERGFTTVNVAEADATRPALAADAGTAPDPQPLVEAGREDYAYTYGDGLTTVNDDPEALVNPDEHAGVLVAPDTPEGERPAFAGLDTTTSGTPDNSTTTEG